MPVLGTGSQGSGRWVVFMPYHKFYAIVPAAGRSRRMGESKLLLPWGSGGRESEVEPLGDDACSARTVIESVLCAWAASCVNRVVVVVRRDDRELRDHCRFLPVDVVAPDHDPIDMKASIQVGIQFIKERFQPASSDGFFIAPADLPTLSTRVIDALADVAKFTSAIVVPKYGKREGHPVLLPWSMTEAVFRLPAQQGINRIVERQEKTIVRFEADQFPQDIDTREQYVLMRNRHRAK